MDQITVKDLNFTYPGRDRKALENVSMSIGRGEFVCLCGRTGSGKTTLLRSMKPILAPHGERTGSIRLLGKDMDELTDREAAARIGYVMQNPDNQIVTDKVWHELAFGLENIGMDPEAIRVRVAEMATFFGIHNWFGRDTDSLSGGQKQMLNLAAVMAMQPDVLLLDEPTASLDPVAAVDFLSTVSRISREIGTTIIIIEHRLDEVLPRADRVIVMDEGRIYEDGAPAKVGLDLIEKEMPMGRAMPAPLRAYAGCLKEGGVDAASADEAAGKTLKDEAIGDAPLDVAAGRRWLADAMDGEASSSGKDMTSQETGAAKPGREETEIEIKDIWMRYERNSADVLKGLSLTVKRGEILAIVGGNGAGKSTLMNVIAGAIRPYRGKVVRGRRPVGALAQNPQLVFTEDTLEEDLKVASGSEEEMQEIVKKLLLEDLLASHPFDLSGGEQQRAALAKVMLAGAEVLLLDEPTKGLDEGYKEIVENMFKEFTAGGGTVIVTTHDVDFCARTAGRCAMLFDGQITGEGPAGRFFRGNAFYTTAANRMSRGITDSLFAEEIIDAVSEKRKRC